jgi:hypothetical protein
MRAGCISNMAFYGGFLIAYPLIGGGFIGSTLKGFGVSENTAYLIGLSVFIGSTLKGFGVSENTAYLIGLSVAYPLSIAFMIVLAWCERHVRQTSQGDLELGIVEVLTFDVRRAWEVGDLDDFGPGFLFETGDGEFVYAASPLFFDFVERFPCTRITIGRLPVSKMILKAECEGNPIAPEAESVSINDLCSNELCSGTGCEVIPPAAMSEQVLDKLGARR